jgi:hypothetical protein
MMKITGALKYREHTVCVFMFVCVHMYMHIYYNEQ